MRVTPGGVGAVLPHRIKLFDVLGTTFWLHMSWLPLAPLIALTLAYVLFPTLVPELSVAAYWEMALAGTLGVFLSVFLRELMQALVCKLCDMPTQGVTLGALGGAWQMRSVRVSDEVWLTMSGLAASLGAGAALLIVLFGTATSAMPLAIAGIVFFLGAVNGGLAVVNLVPAYPLGTGRLLRAALVRRDRSAARAGRVAAALGIFIGIAVAAAGAVALARGSPVSGAWCVLAGGTVCWFALPAYRDEADDAGRSR